MFLQILTYLMRVICFRFEINGMDIGVLRTPIDGIAYSSRDDLLYWKPVTRSSMFSVGHYPGLLLLLP